MKHFITCLFLIVCHSGFSQQVINGFSMPESIVSDGQRFFVSNQGQDFMSKDMDGFISEISSEGEILNQNFLPAIGVLNAPKGMTIVNKVLYVADLDRVVGFNIENRKTVFELLITGAKLLNDICPLEDGFIAVTETISGNIFKIDLEKKTSEILANIPTANGISYNSMTNQLLVCSNGENYGDGSVYLKSGNSDFKKLANMANGFFDGIEWVDNDHILISDWVTFPVNGSGKLWIYDLKTEQSESVFTGESIADIYYDTKTSEIYMPQMLHNRVLISDWEQLKEQQIGVNGLYNYSVLDAFIGGLYRGTLPIKDLKLKGDFGLGAPDMIDGELAVLDGIAYQTTVSGETVVLDNDHKISFASVTFFDADTTFAPTTSLDKTTLLQSIEDMLPNKNKMYAIKISGTFDHIKTRAFPAVEEEPFPVLSSILHHQRFFELEKVEGTLIGFLLPSYLNGINAGGFHFHFLSDDKKQGGHILDFTGKNVQVEIAILNTFELDTPNDNDFQDYEFIKTENESLRKVEQGK